MDPAEALKFALFLGRQEQVAVLLADDPGLGRANFGLMCPLYDAEGVEAALAADPELALRPVGPRRPILHLAFSRHLHGVGKEADMLAVGRLLLAAGADPNDGYEMEPGSGHTRSALYGATGHADNPVLGRFLLEAGATPDDNESLYHSTELGHSHTLRLLLEFGAKPAGTNALLRALDFNDPEKVAMLLAAGADPNEGAEGHPTGRAPPVVSALHQAARRMCGAEVAEILLAAGADIEGRYDGITPYALARVHGNAAVARALADAGAETALSPVEMLLAAAAEGSSEPGDQLVEAGLPMEYRRLLCRLATRDNALEHIRRLVALGLDPDVPDEMDTPPFHLAAWEGRLDVLKYLFTFAPDPDAINGYGGALIGTILHGAENARSGPGADHAGCLRLALEEGAEVRAEMFDWTASDALAGILRAGFSRESSANTG